MSDRELLELAAKAAGIELAEQIAESGWNPLTDDGDAFRLAVKLGIFIDTSDDTVHVQYIIDGVAIPINEYDFDDIYVATRRTIVRAAAEIGRSVGMTEDTVIELAKQAGFLPDVGIPVHPSNLFKFAALVAAAEREECAKVCEQIDTDAMGGDRPAPNDCAAAIRARSTNEVQVSP